MSKATKMVRKTSKASADKVKFTANDGDFTKMISTGSTLLDLAISGEKIRGGGIPGGILLELYGPSSAGKTALLAEISANVQNQGGEIQFLDPEARLDKSYAEIYGVHLSDDENYFMPETVQEVMDHIWDWEPSDSKKINLIGTDSIAALCSKMQMDGTDKRGQAAAKEFSQGLRKLCVRIRRSNWIIAFTNQVRQGDSGEVTPGGMAVPFYSSLRMRIGPPGGSKYITKEAKLRGTKVEGTLGIRSRVKITKSTVGNPFRMADVYIVFGYGLDDIRANLVYCKQFTDGDYDCFGKKYRFINPAINHIESNNLQDKLKERTIDIWQEVQEKLKVTRLPKKR